jgi:RNA polymerase sigma factor (sigma-70 family)
LTNNRVPSSDEDLVHLYLKDIGRHALLSKDEEVKLAQAAEVGRAARSELATHTDLSSTRKRQLRLVVEAGDAAIEAFVNGNLRLVVSIAKNYQAANVPLLDLVQDGNLGLMRAVEKFDWRKGFKFSTYATWWIRQAISRGIVDESRTIRLPMNAADLLKQMAQAWTRLETKHGQRPTTAQLAIELEVSEDRIAEVLRHVSAPQSLSEPLSHDSDVVIGDRVEVEQAVSPSDSALIALLPFEVAKLLAGLDDREREILRLRFGLDRGEPRTLEEVGVFFGLTRERIRQIEARAMSKLRHPTANGASF